MYMYIFFFYLSPRLRFWLFLSPQKVAMDLPLSFPLPLPSNCYFDFYYPSFFYSFSSAYHASDRPVTLQTLSSFMATGSYRSYLFPSAEVFSQFYLKPQIFVEDFIRTLHYAKYWVVYKIIWYGPEFRETDLFPLSYWEVKDYPHYLCLSLPLKLFNRILDSK